MKTRITAFPVTLLFTLMACGSVGVPRAQAAQLGLQQSSSAVPGVLSNPSDTEFCAEPLEPQSSLTEEASLFASDGDLNVSGENILVAQGIIEDCNVGGIPPVGGLPAAAFPLAAVLGGTAGTGTIVACATTFCGGDDSTVTVPEPAEGAMAGLFAGLGVAGIVLRRRLQSPS